MAAMEVSDVPVSLNPNEITLNETLPTVVVSVDTQAPNPAETIEARPRRVPKRVLHFSDGVLEEFSSDDDEADAASDVNRNVLAQALVDPSHLTWGPYLWYKAAHVGNKTLAVCDFLGEHLASFFGITSPKYQFEIEDYFRQKAEDEKARQQQEMDLKNWTSETAEKDAVENQPSSVEWQRY